MVVILKGVLLLLLSHATLGLECYCDQSEGVNPQCGGFNQLCTNSCDGSTGICYTAHIITPSGLLVFAGCLDNATNPVEEMCSGAQNNEMLVHQCCNTTLCNREFFNSNPFLAATTNTTDIATTPDGSTEVITIVQPVTTTGQPVTGQSTTIQLSTAGQSTTVEFTTQPSPTSISTTIAIAVVLTFVLTIILCAVILLVGCAIHHARNSNSNKRWKNNGSDMTMKEIEAGTAT